MSSKDTDVSRNPQSQVDADLQREIDEALGGQSVEDLMSEQASPPAEAGEPDAADGSTAEDHREFHAEMKRGRIAAIRGEDVFVELTGEGKLQGVVPVRQFDRPPRLGSIMDFVVDHVDEDQGLVFLSREGAVSRATWEQLQRGAVVDARVIATNKGGLELEMVGGIRAFMPASQIDMHHVGELDPFVGQKLEGMVQEIDRKSKKVVLSRRALIEHRRAQQREKVLKELEVGQIREGTVSNILDFGAFVDLGGVDGLVHVTDLAYAHVDHPRDVVKPGDKVRVKVLKIDDKKDRISLGMKQVEPDPWESIEGKYEIGKTVEGTVSRTANFGAFIELEPGIDGLLPMSEMSWQRIGKAEDVVKVGDRIRVNVIHVDPAKKRLTLSLKQVAGDPWIGAEHKYARHSVVPGTVKSITDFGAFVELEPGIEGLVHISELSNQRVGRVEDVVNVGDQKEFRVLEISEDDRKVRLSLKQAAELSEAQGGGQQAGERRKSDLPRKARQQPNKNLKSGLGDVGTIGGGMGLGNLRLDNLK